MKTLKTVVLAVLAVLLTAANFMFDLAGSSRETAPSVAFSASLGFALGPAIIGVIAMIWKEHRNPLSFLKIVCVISGLLLLTSLGNISAPPKP
ncbi:MAG: hypothetical protein KDA57_23290 [Planctomycetales bacterium]|nr:hypothetical protein [Planctomycetales bacterium]